MSLARYQFLPWLRRGAAAAVDAPDRPGATLTARASFVVQVDVNGQPVPQQTFRLLGPGDVTGLERRQVIRTDPVAGATDFEPNYFPAAELDEASLPWLFTPASADPVTERLRPWLVLVVVEHRDGVTVRASRDHPLPRLAIASPAHPREELPDLAESWWWAHAQAVVPEDGSPIEILNGDPRLSLARLICPRQLAPSRRYHACIVPAFSAGVRAGLGEAVDEAAPLEPAWRSGDDAPGSIELPVYFHWEFATGPVGDFESLARRLEARPLPAGVGARPLYLGDAGLNLPAIPATTDGVIAGRPGALRRPERSAEPLAPAIAELLGPALEALIDVGARRHLDGASGDEVTPLSVPLYGAWPAMLHRLGNGAPDWIRELNLDPRYRVLAAAGTRAIQLHQEELMQRAWAQVGALRTANDLVRRARFAARVAERVHARNLASLDPGELLQLTAPAHRRIAVAGQTVRARVHDSRVPDAAASPQLRRALRPNARQRTLGRPAAEPERMFRALDAGELRLGAEQRAPDGAIDAAAVGQLGDESEQVELPDSGGFRIARQAAQALRGMGRAGPLAPVDVGVLATAQAPAGFAIVPEINVLGAIAAGVGHLSPVLAVDAPPDVEAPAGVRRGAFEIRPGGRAGEIAARPRAGGRLSSTLAGRLRETLARRGEARPVAEPLAPRELAPGVSFRLEAVEGSARPPVAGMPGLVLTDVFAPAARVGLPNVGRPGEVGGIDPGDVAQPVEPAAVQRFRAAAVSVLKDRLVDSPPVAAPPALDAPRLGAGVLSALAPRPALARRLGVRITMTVADGSANPPVRHGDDALSPFHGAPTFAEPLYRMIEKVDPDLLLPGLERVPADTITLVETNAHAIEACLVGANHEMVRELIWRGFEADRRATAFRRFWDREDGADVPDIHTWTDALGGHALGDPAGQSVVLIRGELLRRYPGAIVLARAARWTEAGHRAVDESATDVEAIFRAQLEPDVAFVGLPLSVEALVGARDPNGLPGFYIVIQEPPTEPRFGLDHDRVARSGLPGEWRDLTWGHLSGGADPASTRFARTDSLPAGSAIGGLQWGRDAAHQAAITLQDPVRLLVHARHLFPQPGEDA